MKLLLASNSEFLITKGYSLLGIPKNNLKIGYVTTAANGSSNREHVEQHKQAMHNQGFNFEEIDIENKSIEEQEKFFANKNVIHVEGGNTFYLLQAIKKTGFEKLIKKFIIDGKIYVGTSAGSSIAGPTIALSSHLPSKVDPDDLIALNLVPFCIKCHVTEAKLSVIQKQAKKIDDPIKLLRDGQGLLVTDNQYQLVGDGPEININIERSSE